MDAPSRRAVLAGVSVTAVISALIAAPGRALAAQCVTGSYPPFLPNMLTVDCASRANFKLFRQNAQYLGLAGAVSMTFVRGRYGSYQAGNLFLFPWLKPKGAALGPRQWGSVFPKTETAVLGASPIPNAALPLDEYFCRYVLQAPTAATFIGFSVDEPYSALEVKLGLYSNATLADKKQVGIDWASSNCNHPWFGGDRQIPATETCNGKAWRQLIVDGLNRASLGAC